MEEAARTRSPRAPPRGCKRLTVDTNEDAKVLPVYQHPTVSASRYKRYYTFLVIGQTGTGKTTLLDAFVNCLAGQTFSDNWRWKLVDENELNKLQSGSSKTREVSYYIVNDERNADVECNIRIIDTPGFGDSKGFKQDDETVKKFEALFAEISEIDYVLVTVKATETRWTLGNRYIYDRVQQIFGKDAAERFILMCTFADTDAIPVAVRTLRPHLTFNEYFTFNNSALYIPSQSANKYSANYWRMGNDSIAEFLRHVVLRNQPPLSLSMSLEVLRQRECLSACVENTVKRIKDSFKTLEILFTTMEQIEKNKRKLDANADFTYEEEVLEFKRTTLDNYYQACSVCNVTCCKVCVWPANKVISQCTFFQGGRGCPKCPGNCPKSDHVRTNELITRVTVRKRKEHTDMKEAWLKAKSGKSASEWVLDQKKKKMTESAKKIVNDIKVMKEKLAELDKIALKPRVFTDQDYFNELIKFEEESREPGHETRIAGYRIMLDQARNFEQITNAESVTDLFPQHEKVFGAVFKGEFKIPTSNSSSRSSEKKEDCSVM